MAIFGYEMVSYADDFVILCRSQETTEAALEESNDGRTVRGLIASTEKTTHRRQSGKEFDFWAIRSRELRFRVRGHLKMVDTLSAT